MTEFKTYDDEELTSEIRSLVESMGGTLTEVDFAKHILNIDIHPDNEEELLLAMEDVMSFYIQKRQELLDNDPFLGVKDILKGADDDTDS